MLGAQTQPPVRPFRAAALLATVAALAIIPACNPYPVYPEIVVMDGTLLFWWRGGNVTELRVMGLREPPERWVIRCPEDPEDPLCIASPVVLGAVPEGAEATVPLSAELERGVYDILLITEHPDGTRTINSSTYSLAEATTTAMSQGPAPSSNSPLVVALETLLEALGQDDRQ